ncbi:MAG TPA: penicillin acylase family protein, partial [Candidatus Dormibacteraeota bacterium]|nr:penicillin acylase family protein [Candidatus Dormibacteraeota bacterium]
MPRTRLINLAAALVVSALLLYVAFSGAGPLPALGPAFNPTTGAWTMAADAQITDRSFSISPYGTGLEHPARVVLEQDGTAHITAQTDHDLFFATGYVHAKFRLLEMDLARRQGEGRLSEIVGAAAIDSDRFELQLGLLRTAWAEWNALPADDPLRDVLTAYSAGVNTRIAEAEASNQLDPLFALLDYRPAAWRPIDTLVIKGDQTQGQNFTDTPLLMALANKSLGADLATEWFPVLPPNQQSPYDPGPYAPASIAPIEPMPAFTDAQTQSEVELHKKLAALPSGLVAKGGSSNNWAVAPTRSLSGGAMMSGDPHLHLTLPSVWFQMTQDSPGLHASGVAIPGTPGVLLGHNQHIAWSLTDSQNQQTFFYQEKQDAAHPNQYFWKGAWQNFQTVSYDIPVLHGQTQHLTVKLTVHGPVISDRGITTSVWWAGNLPSQDIRVLTHVARASNFKEFRDALREWYSPTLNWVYADDAGNIGLISAGYYPQVAKGQPWLPMPGTGDYDVVGTIPYDAIPQAYNPSGGYVWSANQRQVTKDFPYYVGTSADFFDPGYRANEIRRVLNRSGKLGPNDLASLQTDTRDFQASEIVPVLLQTLKGKQLSAKEAAARDLIQTWDFRMDTDSAAATVWARFWGAYEYQTFSPWWKSRAVRFDMSEVWDTLGQDLDAWTLSDPTNRAFSAPGVGSRTAVEAQVAAFQTAVRDLSNFLGPDPRSWTWGRVHQRTIDSLAHIEGLSYGPRAERGDDYTPLASHGDRSEEGPSWRMVVDWGSRTFESIYPGGQSENPASDWYADRVDTWWRGS